MKPTHSGNWLHYLLSHEAQKSNYFSCTNPHKKISPGGCYINNPLYSSLIDSRFTWQLQEVVSDDGRTDGRQEIAAGLSGIGVIDAWGDDGYATLPPSSHENTLHGAFYSS
jgi:hypothetical protein